MPLLKMTLNGKPVQVDVDPGALLAHVLRDKLNMIGTKIGCGEGECGACTVLVDGVSVCSCIYPALKAQGCTVTTIEGLSSGGKLHPVQEAFVDHFAAQCGFCTPGFIMSSVSLLQESPHPSHEEILVGLSGNLCRCTGYYQIVEAVEDAEGRIGEVANQRGGE